MNKELRNMLARVNARKGCRTERGAALRVRSSTGSFARLLLAAAVAGFAASALRAAESESGKGTAGFGNYVERLPGGTIIFEMVAIPGGEVTVGSLESEAGRDKFDLAPRKMKIKGFWMEKYEISWAEFLPFVFLDKAEILRQVDKLEGIVDKDGVSHPTKPYGSVYRERGEKGYPAIGMGYPSAREFCKWLSKKTGHHYRLPTEEEWEYACRAGADTPYFWGSDPAGGAEYGWSKENSKDTTHPIGKLKPNKFGLYDIVGNVAEWVAKSDTNSPGVAKGGAWSEPAAKMRSASRMIETPEWNELDPQFPQSVWWLSAADFIGFRVVRSFDEQEPPATAKAATGEPAPAATQATAATSGETLANYKKYCASCHGIDGKGQTKLGVRHKVRDYTATAVKATLKDDAMFKAIKEGIKEKDSDTMAMQKYGDKFTDEQIKALVAYMKGL